ncbi:hypothetical protein BGW38_000942 [Lunasporangiospora selenospora]|uniref:Cytidyltransferase-like domain-containing protein n=1 Tax=Lunasporangiospora selenospora TaxID=979761 RepID=A0A9P6FU46_9FUNG|nr:hypothetical protein BGW38_000942 [Lunasporangiospora selenospora]
MTTNASLPHGLLLVYLHSFNVDLDDTFLSIRRALVSVQRLTIALSFPEAPNTTAATSILQEQAPHDSGIDSVQGAKRGESTFHNVQRVLSALYVCFTKEAVALQRPLAELDIVFQDSCGYAIGAGAEDVIPFSVFMGMPHVADALEKLNASRAEQGYPRLPIVTLDQTPVIVHDTHLVDALDLTVPYTLVREGEYTDTALGGTFDHLHAGHKILLSMTAWITSHRVVCGVTDDTMLATKKFKEFLEPLDHRIRSVERFLRTFKRGLIYEVVPIHDIYGPTITDNKLEALMVSKETIKGGAAVNQERQNRDLKPLEIEVINVISSNETTVDEISLKISSTYIRQYLSEQRTTSK